MVYIFEVTTFSSNRVSREACRKWVDESRMKFFIFSNYVLHRNEVLLKVTTLENAAYVVVKVNNRFSLLCLQP